MVDALAALVAAVPLDTLITHVDFIRNCVSSTVSDARHRTGVRGLTSVSGEFFLPLFSVPKGLDPLLAILLHGLMNGSVAVRESAADGLGELVAMTDAAALKPYLIKTTGPLIRVVGDRFPSSVKAAILQTLIVLLDKGGTALKAFVPQLQTTFVKNLSDPTKQVRLRCVEALGKIMPHSARVDPLLTELAIGCGGGSVEGAGGTVGASGSNAIRASVLDALNCVLLISGDKATPAALEKVREWSA